MAVEEAQLGLATTDQLLHELEVRFQISTPDETARQNIRKLRDNLSLAYLNYRTVDG